MSKFQSEDDIRKLRAECVFDLLDVREHGYLQTSLMVPSADQTVLRSKRRVLVKLEIWFMNSIGCEAFKMARTAIGKLLEINENHSFWSI